MGTSINWVFKRLLYAPGYAPYIYIVFGNLFLAYAPGYAPGPKASKFQPMFHGPEPSATFAVAPMLLQEKRYAPRYVRNLKLPSAAWGSLPLKLGMRWPHSSLVIWIQLEQNQDPTGIHLEHSQGQRSGNLFQAYAPGYAPGPKASKFQPMLLGHA